MPESDRPDEGVPPEHPVAPWVATVLCTTAFVLWAGPWQFRSPAAPPRPVAPAMIDPGPVRHPHFKPEIELAGFTYHCTDCHRHFPSPPETTRSLTQHRNIELRHGLNTRCFNCHHLTNRDAFVDDWGREIPYDQPQMLCSKCHGTVYRDWLAGSHGRTNGYWDSTKGKQERRRCIECHDPHHPPFPALQPAPPPNTLRMGDQSFPPDDETVHNPLKVLAPANEQMHSATHPAGDNLRRPSR